MATFIEKLASNPNALVVLTVPKYAQTTYQLPATITGLVEADLAFDLTSEYSQDDDGATASLRGINAAFNRSQSVQKTVQQTLKYWNGSSCPVFQIPITLVKLQQNTDVTSIAKILLGGVVPTYSGIESQAPYRYYTPAVFSISALNTMYSDAVTAFNNNQNGLISAGYDAIVEGFTSALNIMDHKTIISNIRNTWTLQYAQWFRADSLILTKVSFIGTKENAKGNTWDPYMVKLVLTFTTSYTPDRDTVMSWFIAGNTNYTEDTTDAQKAKNFLISIAPTGG
jgi:hypothetical protein